MTTFRTPTSGGTFFPHFMGGDAGSPFGRMMPRVAFSPDIEGSGGGGSGGSGNANPTPEPQTFSLDYVRELRAENKGWRLKAVELEKAAAEAKALAEKAAAEAKGAAEKAAKDAEERISQAQQATNARIIQAELRAQAVKSGMIDLDGLKLLDTSAVTLDDKGEVVVPKDFFDEARKAKPYLFAATGAEKGNTSNPNPAPKPAPTSDKKADDLKGDEYAAELAALTRGGRR